MEPRIDETLRIPALDGFELAATLYEPASGAGDGGPMVLINSAMAVRRRYYDGYARHLADQGFTVLTYDYRGIGGSRPRRLSGFRARMRQWGEQDFAGVLDWVAGHLQPRRLLVVGHSVGGQIAGLAENNHRIHALITVGSQNGWWRHWPVPSRYRIALTWYVAIPVVTRVYGYLPGRFGTKEDLPAGVAREWARWGRRRSHLLESEDERAGFARLRIPLLAYSFTDDDYAPRPAVEALLDLYSEADVHHRHLAPRDAGAEAVGHFGFFRDRFRDTLWRDSAAWLQRQASPSPDAPNREGVDLAVGRGEAFELRQGPVDDRLGSPGLQGSRLDRMAPCRASSIPPAPAGWKTTTCCRPSDGWPASGRCWRRRRTASSMVRL